jgi:PAS domain S-box-containing protein
MILPLVVQKMEQQINDKIQLVIQKLADGVLVFDENNNLSIINPQAEGFLEINSKKVLGKSMTEITQFPNLKMVTNFFDYSKAWGIFKKEIYNNDIKGKILEVNTIPLVQESKRTGTLLFIRDVTREKNIERTKDEFVSLAAHQLRTPLAAIKWTLSVLVEQRAGILTPEQKDIVDKSYKSTIRMINLINDLLDITRLEEGKYIFTMTPESLQDITQDVIYNMRDAIKKKGIKLEFEKPEYLFPRVKMDKAKIKIVIENLIENAVKYTPPGKKVTILLENNKIDVGFKIQSESIDIPQVQQGKVFTKFFRSSNAVKTETDGSGPGLYLSKNIIDAHRGEIGFSSEENKGTTFWFKIPAKEEFEEILERF